MQLPPVSVQQALAALVPASQHLNVNVALAMRESTRGGGLSPKALHEFLARQRSSQDHFHRHGPSQALLPGFEHDAHATAADAAQQAATRGVLETGAHAPAGAQEDRSMRHRDWMARQAA